MYQKLPLCIALLIASVGCGGQSKALTPPNDSASAPAEESNDKAILQSAKSLFERAKKTGSTQADSAKQWLGERLQQTAESSEATAQQSAAWIAEQFEQARAAGETTAANAQEWVTQDIQRMGSWQYTSVSFDASTKPKEVVEKLNQLGNQRWECILVDSQGGEKTFYFKRGQRSYLNQIPAKELLRLVPMLGNE